MQSVTGNVTTDDCPRVHYCMLTHAFCHKTCVQNFCAKLLHPMNPVDQLADDKTLVTNRAVLNTK